MPKKYSLFFFVMGFALSHQALGIEEIKTKEQNSCVVLGPNPSFIIKFKKTSLLSKRSENMPLKSAVLKRLSQNEIQFSKSQPISDGAYTVYFSLPQKAAAKVKQTACYPKETLNRLMNDIKQQGEVEYIAPNKLSAPESQVVFPEVPIDPVQWNLLSLPAGIQAQGAWEHTRGKGSVIAVLDTGRLDNEALNPNILPGVHFSDGGVSYGTSSMPSCDTCPIRIHGTYVAGIIAAPGVAAYSMRLYGVGPEIKVMPVNVFSKVEDAAACGVYNQTSPCLLTYDSDQLNALNWLSGHEPFPGLPTPPRELVGINMSLSGPGECGSLMQEAFDRLIAKNIAVAASAGNQNTQASSRMPANCRGVIPVAAVGPSGNRAYYSNYGDIVKIAAPGGSVQEGNPTGLIYSTTDARYEAHQGTSGAAPHVAGLIGLLSTIDPSLTPSNIFDLMRRTASPFPVSNDLEKNCKGVKSCGAGIINAAAAADKAKEEAAIIAWNKNLSVSVTDKKQATVYWQPAKWHPERTTPIIYTVHLNGELVSDCKEISELTCTLKDLQAEKKYRVTVKATDPRGWYGPEEIATEFSTF